MAKTSCETCPHRIPMDKDTWDRVKEAQREATPHLSRQVCARLTKIERENFEGLEANVENCEGYSKLQAIGNYMLRFNPARRIKKTEAGGLRFVKWSEKTCNNPWLDSPEYFELQDQFDAIGSEGHEKKEILPFKTEAQREAFWDGEVGKLRMISGAALIAAGAAGVEAAPEPISTGAAGLAGYGLYRAATGAYDMVSATWTERQEFKKG